MLALMLLLLPLLLPSSLLFSSLSPPLSKSWSAEFLRRTDQVPPAAKEMKHHPSSVDNLLVEQLIHQSKTNKLQMFLRTSDTNTTRTASVHVG